MRRAILWLDGLDWPMVLLGVGVVLTVAFLAGPLIGAILLLPWNSNPHYRTAMALGDSIALAGTGAFFMGRSVWPRIVGWAKSPPAVKPLPAEFCRIDAPAPDAFEEAARREVEAIAPSDPE